MYYAWNFKETLEFKTLAAYKYWISIVADNPSLKFDITNSKLV